MVFRVIYTKDLLISRKSNNLGPITEFLIDTNNQFEHADRKIERITEGLLPFFDKQPKSTSANNSATICDYISTMNREINFLQSYRKDSIKILCTLSTFVATT